MKIHSDIARINFYIQRLYAEGYRKVSSVRIGNRRELELRCEGKPPIRIRYTLNGWFEVLS